MYNLMKAIFEAQSKNDEDGEMLVNDTALVLREFIIEAFGQVGVDEELKRVAKIITDGN